MSVVIGIIILIFIAILTSYFIDKNEQNERFKEINKKFEQELQVPKCRVILKLKNSEQKQICTDYFEPELLRTIAYDLIIPSKERAQNLINQLFNNGYILVNERVIFVEQLEDVQLELETK